MNAFVRVMFQKSRYDTDKTKIQYILVFPSFLFGYQIVKSQ